LALLVCFLGYTYNQICFYLIVLRDCIWTIHHYGFRNILEFVSFKVYPTSVFFHPWPLQLDYPVARYTLTLNGKEYHYGKLMYIWALKLYLDHMEKKFQTGKLRLPICLCSLHVHIFLSIYKDNTHTVCLALFR
jgi:hypothetical protein